MLLFLSLTLVFSLTFSIVSSAYTPSEEDLRRQDLWEELNQKKTDAYDHINTPGNYYTGNYVKAVSNAVGYAEYLLYQANSTYDELKEMSEYFDFLETERDNPANQSFPYHYTVAFTNTLGWEEPIYAYVWNSKGTIDYEWPGLEMDGSYINEYGQRQYYVNVPESADYIIFSSKSGVQTVDIPLYNKTGYYPSAQVDSKGNYKFFSWHITDPNYKEFSISTPTEAPTQTVPTETTPINDDERIPHLSPDDPDEAYINWFLPKHDTPVKIKLVSNGNSIRQELYELLVEADRTLAKSWISVDDSSFYRYLEKLQRVRDHSAALYNDTRSMDHELTGALKTLQLALDDAPYGRIIDYLRYYFIYIEYPEPVTEPTEAPTEPVTEPTEAPTETPTEPTELPTSNSNFEPGTVLVELKSGSDVEGLLEGFEIESVRLITPGSSAQNVYYVRFKERSKEIVWKAIDVLKKSPNVKYAEPNYYGSYLPVVAPFISETFVKAVREYERYESITERDILVLLYEELSNGKYVLRFYLKDYQYPENMVEVTFGRYTLISPNPEPVIYDGEKIYTIKSAFEQDIITQSEMKGIASLSWLNITKAETLMGDADCDSKVTIVDATQIQRSLASYAKANSVDRENADMDGDGRVTVIDATKIQRRLASIE